MSLINIDLSCYTEDDVYDEIDTSKRVCLISGDEIKEGDDFDELPCGHIFLHSNIYDWCVQNIEFSNSVVNYSFFKAIQCPYCRSKISNLPLREGETPLKGVHKEYGEYKKLLAAKKLAEKKKKKKELQAKKTELLDILKQELENDNLSTFLNGLMKKTLVSYCKLLNIKGYSKYNKKDLCTFVLQNLQVILK